MTHLKRDEVVAVVNESGHYHVDCYGENLIEIKLDNILTENDIDNEDWYFCNFCNKQIIF